MKPKRKNIVGPYVKTARISGKLKLTQDKLAVRLQLLGWTDCDRFTISKIELGTRRVTDHEVELLSKALAVPPNYLFGQEE